MILVDSVLRIRDIDKEEITSFKSIHADALKICKETGAILNLVVSDVDVYLETSDQSVAERVRACFGPNTEMTQEGPKEYRIF